MRLCQREFALLDARFGPFTEFVGAERRHTTDNVERLGLCEYGSRLWVHPAHNTVGSALRLIGERLSGYDGDDSSHRGPPPSGVIVVPYAPSAMWWGLVRHFTCVGRWEVGSSHLEMNQLGVWRGVRSNRASLALAFPRSSGKVSPVEVREGQYLASGSRLLSEGYVVPPDMPRTLMLPLLTGSFVYSPAENGKDRGELLLVWDAFRPQEEGREYNEEGNMAVSCAELLLVKKRGQASKVYHFVKGHVGKGGSFAEGPSGHGTTWLPWEVDTKLLWVVDHLVTVDGPLEPVQEKGTAHSSSEVRLGMAELSKRSFTFDYKRAVAEIEQAKLSLYSTSELTPPSPSPSAISVPESVQQGMAELQLAEGENEDAGAAELAAARASANEAVALRTHPKVVAKPPKSVVAPTVNISQRETICRYSSQRCEGCKVKFNFGEKIVVGARSMVHPGGECRALALEHQRKRDEEAKAGRKTLDKVNTVQSAKAAALADGERLTRVRMCLQHMCDCCDGEKYEPRVMCLRPGCSFGVHLVGCVRASKSYAAAGRLICLSCRLDGILEDGSAGMYEAPESLKQQVTLAMINELTSGAVATAQGRDQFANLERRWMSEVCAGGDGSPARVILPRHSIESFIIFMWWIVTEADRARSFATIMRAAGSVMSMLELNDWTKTSRVKAQAKEIEKKYGVSPYI